VAVVSPFRSHCWFQRRCRCCCWLSFPGVTWSKSQRIWMWRRWARARLMKDRHRELSSLPPMGPLFLYGLRKSKKSLLFSLLINRRCWYGHRLIQLPLGFPRSPDWNWRLVCPILVPKSINIYPYELCLEGFPNFDSSIITSRNHKGGVVGDADFQHFCLVIENSLRVWFVRFP